MSKTHQYVKALLAFDGDGNLDRLCRLQVLKIRTRVNFGRQFDLLNVVWFLWLISRPVSIGERRTLACPARALL